MNKTLRAFKYKGYPVYIRHIEGRNYESLFYFRDEIHCRPLYIEKDRAQEKRLTLKQRHAGAVLTLTEATKGIIDDFLSKYSIGKVAVEYIKNLFSNLYGKITTRVGRTKLTGKVPANREA